MSASLRRTPSFIYFFTTSDLWRKYHLLTDIDLSRSRAPPFIQLRHLSCSGSTGWWGPHWKQSPVSGTSMYDSSRSNINSGTSRHVSLNCNCIASSDWNCPMLDLAWRKVASRSSRLDSGVSLYTLVIDRRKSRGIQSLFNLSLYFCIASLESPVAWYLSPSAYISACNSNADNGAPSILSSWIGSKYSPEYKKLMNLWTR